VSRLAPASRSSHGRRIVSASAASRRRRRGAVALVAGLAVAAAILLPGRGASSRAAVPAAPGEVVPQTDDAVPAPNVTMIGSSPQEAPNETWGVGQGNGSAVFHSTLVRYTKESGWTLGPEFQDATGSPLAAFHLASAGGGAPSPLAGRITATGSGVLAGEEPPVEGAKDPRQVILVRDPGGAFREAPALPASGEAALKSGETLFATGRAPLLAALDESPGRAGALIAPVTESGAESAVLHWDGTAWTREPIELPAATSSDFRVLAIGAASRSNAWLLGQLSSGGPYPPAAVALFHRKLVAGAGAVWVPVGGDGEAHPLLANGATFTVAHTGEPPAVRAQLLTVTDAGVWVDGERSDTHASTTMFFKPEGEGGGVAATWCAASCDHELPVALPNGSSRSFAWASPGAPFGERVITGLPEGATLRLEGTTFVRVLGLGGSPDASPGEAYGAAFSNASEGWLGQQQLPVHLTVEPVASRLTTWPVSFRHALLAVAPQPGVPVGAISSQAIAVGDQGEVARYIPGDGWTPESLLSAGGRRETPRLRAVAWPTPMRAYAVGDSGTGPQMWLWRGETGLWEPDPAIPYNFRGNLMGIAFDPNNPARGYAVGESGVLLSYGKSWTQERELPAEVAGATFTSIAFAGSEAIVAYRKLLDRSRVSSYAGGILVNEGSGWHVDQAAAGVIGSEVPSVVAGLPDGGAAFATESLTTGEGARIFERQAAGASWQAAPTPFPGGASPGSLTLFREGGAVRAVAAGTAPAGFDVENVPPSPPGFPPPLIAPYGVGSNVKSGVLRQTSTGWSDEEHELNNATEPPGGYSRYDTVYQPDPVAAVLVGPTGAQGWAVGGFVDSVNSGGVLDTADIERYPADGAVPTGVGSAPIALDPGRATFAIGGGAQCAAPCAQRAEARIGPDVWLQSALTRASQIGVRAFIYTGPRVTRGETLGPPTLALPYTDELERYAALLRQAPPTLPTFAAATPTDLDGLQAEGAAFHGIFGALPQDPFGGSSGIEAVSAAGDCGDARGCQAAYYSFNSIGQSPTETVRVIVLDDTGDVGSAQLAWLEAELRSAKAAHTPALAIGNADLNSQSAAGDGAAAAVARALVNPAASASAYFFDAPEHNVTEKLPGSSIPAFGSGTLGYVNFLPEQSGAFTGASGFLLGEVEFAQYNASTNVAPVTASLIPNIGELALEAKSGTLLKRSQAALFAGLARRPRAGNVSGPGEVKPETDPYIPIPAECVGTACANGLFPRYKFTSSRPDLGNFVKQNLALEPGAVLLDANGEPIPDEESGLFCAYNAGTTIVTISAGGLSASLPVTIQAGSVRRPCGTQPLKELPASASGGAAVPPSPAPSPAPAGTAPSSAPPPLVPVPPSPGLPAAHVPAPPAPTPFLLVASPATALLAVVPPPLPTPARPTPPSGTSAVTSPVEAPEKEEKEEEATESVGNNAAVYRPAEHEAPPLYLLSILVLAAFAGATVRRRPRHGRRDVRVAPATVNAARWQRRASRDDGRSH
jgi:hypothetical protein